MHKSVQTAAEKFTRIQEIKSLTLRILKKTTPVSPSFDKICYQKISALVLHAFNLFVLLAQLSEAFYHVITFSPVMF